MLSQLLNKIALIENITIHELANICNYSNFNIKKQKGGIGLLIEKYLNCQNPNRSGVDFPKINLELKTIPIHKNKAKESTFINYTKIPFIDKNFFKSGTWNKVQNILWVGINFNKNNFQLSRITKGFLWQCPEDISIIFENDWNSLNEIITYQQWNLLTARIGKYLQLRPKALNSKNKNTYYDIDGNVYKLPDQGFYLKTIFTNKFIIPNLI